MSIAVIEQWKVMNNNLTFHTNPIACNWMKLERVEMQIPKPIAHFIEATNHHNTDALLAVLSDTAVLSDEGHDYRGIGEIKKWSDEKLIGAKVTLQPIRTVERSGKTIVTAKVDGNFDKTGLPDPFQMDFHFTIDSNKVTTLSIRFPESIE